MDPFTHIVLTRKLVSRRPRITLAGIGPDAPFFFTYPAWVIAHSKGRQALTTNDWPAPPGWLETIHHACHSLPVALMGAVVIRLIGGRWPRQALMAWVLHILVDIPTHSRRQWGPRFLWPLSKFVFDGISWADLALGFLRRVCPDRTA